MIHSMTPHRVTLQRLTRNPVGGSVEVAESFADVPALVQGAQRPVTDREGSEVTANAMVFLRPEAPFDFAHNDWRVEWEGRTWEVISYTKESDALTGVDHHLVLMVK